MNSASFELELQKTFLSEAQEMLEDTEKAFVEIEDSPNDTQILDRIFRLVHTIKGSAQMAGFPELGTFAHHFETLLGLLREQKLAIDAGVVDVLLAGNDFLRDGIARLRQDKKAVLDASAVVARINFYLQLRGPEGSEAAVKGGTAIDETRSAPAAQPASPTAPVFLVVDDDRDVLNLLDEYLSYAGYEVITTQDPLAALQIFRTKRVNIVFSDLEMPGMDGIELVRRIRANNQFVPIAMISGRSQREHFKDYLSLGIDSFIEKPFTIDDILAVAERLLRESQLRQALASLAGLSFKIYVSVEKILSAQPLGEQLRPEKAYLDGCMEELRQATSRLLASERARRGGDQPALNYALSAGKL